MECNKEVGAKIYAQDRDAVLARVALYDRTKRHGLTEEQFQAMLIAQEGRCASCSADFGNGKICIDHDHACCPGRSSCGKCVRALLCDRCNKSLGLFKDDPSLLCSAAEYLMRHQKENPCAS